MKIILPRRCHLKLFQGKKLLWNKETYNCEYLAGVLAASYAIIPKISNEIKEINDFNDFNDFDDFYWKGEFDLSSFLLQDSILEENIVYYRNYFGSRKYHLWLQASLPFRYNLFNFQHFDFIRGFLELCNFFHVDFRNYCYGGIYDRQGNYYYLLNYNAFQKSETYVSLMSHDMEEEQRDNENVIELLHKDY